MKNEDILLLDGECGLCNGIAIFMHPRLNPEAKLTFMTNESEQGRKIIENFPEKYQKADTVYLIRNGESYIRSAAAIRFLLYLKWQYKFFYPFCWVIPYPLRDFVYRIISKNRHKIFAKPDVCIIPTLDN